jgi:hypothetical protein
MWNAVPFFLGDAMKTAFVIAATILLCSAAWADTYIWKDPSGREWRTSNPPPDGTPYIRLPKGQKDRQHHSPLPSYEERVPVNRQESESPYSTIRQPGAIPLRESMEYPVLGPTQSQGLPLRESMEAPVLGPTQSQELPLRQSFEQPLRLPPSALSPVQEKKKQRKPKKSRDTLKEEKRSR